MSFFGSFWKKDSENTRKSSSSGRWQVGDKIADCYEILEILGGEGRSGMGVVYVCYSHKHKTNNALKTFQDKYLLSEESQKLFEREAFIWTELERYPYIVRAWWVEKLENRLVINLEYIPPDSQGRNTLTHYLGNLTLPDILKFSIQFCYGMEYAYSKGIYSHRDIKPDNIMITPDKIVKITDFGLAKAFQEIQFKEDIISSGENTGLSIFQTKGGKRACGTLPYMAPEQFDGYADRRSDIYSFGITLYQMVTAGRLPFVGRTQEEYERLHKHKEIQTISSPLFPIIQKCVEKEPNERYQDFVSIREELQGILLAETGTRIAPSEIKELEAFEWSNKGAALDDLGKHQEALSCYDKALDIDPRYALGWSNKGVALADLDRYQEALSCYDKALDIDPRLDSAWSNKGFALFNLGRYQEALSCFDKALDIDPRYVLAWYNKGFALFNLGKHQEALSCFDKVLDIDPRYVLAWGNKGAVLFNLGKHQKALSCFDKVLDIDPRNAPVWCNKGVALANLGRLEEALKCAEEAIKLNPNSSQAHQLKQIIFQQLGG